MKRQLSATPSLHKSQRATNAYAGYTVSAGDQIAVVENAADFRAQFVDCRRPVVWKGSRPVDLLKFRLDAIANTLDYSENLQVERKTGYGFGLGKTRERMPLQLIVERLAAGDDSYYLTTQYEDDSADETAGGSDAELAESDSDGLDMSGAFSDTDLVDFSNLHDDYEDSGAESGSEVDTNAAEAADGDAETSEEDEDEDGGASDDAWIRVKSLFQPPLTNLAHDADFPVTPAIFSNLVTQQINLWMGSSATTQKKPDLLAPTAESLGKYLPRGNSSGLHHDHADNLYVLVSGKKRFTLYLPADAETLQTVGSINKVYANGLIDYCVDKNARLWRPMREDGAILAEWAHWALEQDGVSKKEQKRLRQIIESEPKYTGEYDCKIDPPSFSRIPPILAHLEDVKDPQERALLSAFAQKTFPGFLGLHKLEVWLDPGDMLYIPTGWFHEVSSFAGDDKAHIALNWWFVPPSGSIENPYEDDYWRDDFAQTLLSVHKMRGEAA